MASGPPSAALPAVAPLRVQLTASPQNVTLGETVDLTANATGGIPPYTYAWVTPLGCARPDTSSLNCTPNETGKFTVSVTVTDSATAHNSPVTASTVVGVKAVSPPPGSPPPASLYLFAGAMGITAAGLTAFVIVVFWRRRSRHHPMRPISEHPYVPPPDEEQR